MKILHISTYDLKGGAARATYRLHTGLSRVGLHSEMLVRQKSGDDSAVCSPIENLERAYSWFRPRLAKQLLMLQKTSNPILHSLNVLPSGVAKQINNSHADLVNLHWVGDEMLSVGEIGRIEKPTVWTLHDEWAFCGAEHYDEVGGAERYKESYLKENRNPGHTGLDLDRWTWGRKQRHWMKRPMTLVSPSQWLGACARESFLFKHCRVEVIPNGLDTDLYKPHDKKWARQVLNLPHDKKLVLFGAANRLNDEIKGFHLLHSALISSELEQANLVIFGASRPEEPVDFGMTTRYMGRLYDDYSLVLLYSAADVMVVPSIKEAFGQTASEALSCGTPVVAFDATGLKDIVDHKQNGYLARSYDPEDLARGIQWVLADGDRHIMLAKAARDKAVAEYAMERQARRYEQLYREVLSGS